jgi:hypothetical protein
MYWSWSLAGFRHSGQLLPKMVVTKSSRRNEGSKWARTSAFIVPKVVRGRCLMPTVNASRIRRLKAGLPATALQRAEEEHPARMVEQQVILGMSDEVGDVAGQRGVGHGDARDGVDRLGVHASISNDGESL